MARIAAGDDARFVDEDRATTVAPREENLISGIEDQKRLAAYGDRLDVWIQGNITKLTDRFDVAHRRQSTPPFIATPPVRWIVVSRSNCLCLAGGCHGTKGQVDGCRHVRRNSRRVVREGGTPR